MYVLLYSFFAVLLVSMGLIFWGLIRNRRRASAADRAFYALSAAEHEEKAKFWMDEAAKGVSRSNAREFIVASMAHQKQAEMMRKAGKK